MTDTPALPFIPARDFHSGRLRTVRYVVVHDMEAPQGALTAENVAGYFQHPDSPSSAHICVDLNSAVRCVHDDDTACAAPNANADGWHIEHAGYSRQTSTDWLTPDNRAMLAISAKVAAARITAWGWTADEIRHLTPAQILDGTSRGFIGHLDATLVLGGGDHRDPGTGFPWDLYLSFVRAAFGASPEGDDMTPDECRQVVREELQRILPYALGYVEGQESSVFNLPGTPVDLRKLEATINAIAAKLAIKP